VLGLEKQTTRVVSATTRAQPRVRLHPIGKPRPSGKPHPSGQDEREPLAGIELCDGSEISKEKCHAEVVDGLLGENFSPPYHITVQLTVDTSHETVQKLSTLLDHVQGGVNALYILQ